MRLELLTVHGLGFATGLVLEVTNPLGTSSTVGSQDIQSLTSSAFGAMVLLATSGSYALVVREPSGVASDPFQLTVTADALASPTISSVTPASTAKSSQPQVVSLSGSNFKPPVTIRVIDPLGVSTQIDGGGVTLATASSIQFSLTLNQIGLYSLTVTGADGIASNSVIVYVQYEECRMLFGVSFGWDSPLSVWARPG